VLGAGESPTRDASRKTRTRFTTSKTRAIALQGFMNTDPEILFNDDHKRVQAVGFDYDGVFQRLDGNADDGDAVRGDSSAIEKGEIVRLLLNWLTPDNVSVLEAGQRLFILKHIPNPVTSQHELAKRINMDPANLSRKIKEVRATLNTSV
jgi:hypothetical protein